MKIRVEKTEIFGVVLKLLQNIEQNEVENSKWNDDVNLILKISYPSLSFAACSKIDDGDEQNLHYH